MTTHASTTTTNAPAHDDLIGGEVKTIPLPLVAGTYTRGQVLGTVAGGIGALASAAVATAICPFDVTLAEATDLALYVGGEFNEDKLNLNGQTLADVKIALAQRGIYIRKWGAA